MKDEPTSVGANTGDVAQTVTLAVTFRQVVMLIQFTTPVVGVVVIQVWIGNDSTITLSDVCLMIGVVL